MDRQQRVMIGDTFSNWVNPTGGMSQGTYLGSYVFLSLIDDLKSLLELRRLVDDCTLTEIKKKLNTSRMQNAARS